MLDSGWREVTCVIFEAVVGPSLWHKFWDSDTPGCES